MLIPSKLSRPVRLEHTVVRERLLAKLSGANNYRLVLITSPAGYGKTTLISQWAAGKNDLGWFSLDEGDNQQERFASYLIAAIQQATGNHCAASEAMVQKRQYASLSSLFAQLFIELADWQCPLYLVIDDYHLINNPVIHDAMRFFLRHQPENMTLVVLSRKPAAAGHCQPARPRSASGDWQPAAGLYPPGSETIFRLPSDVANRSRRQQPAVRRCRRVGHRAAAHRPLRPPE
ncbi:transcriptional regulator MalT [Klebsiella variicola]|uniref:Transcriptional regulator MalT n=1 Tax=Klebsiella variicola TaxID=244366 RepID=A0A7H4M8Z2_KLEVA|nr:transcriptional regulator MalT [Klebsiella variicola]